MRYGIAAAEDKSIGWEATEAGEVGGRFIPAPLDLAAGLGEAEAEVSLIVVLFSLMVVVMIEVDVNGRAASGWSGEKDGDGLKDERWSEGIRVELFSFVMMRGVSLRLS